jgi:hypothetical protein
MESSLTEVAERPVLSSRARDLTVHPRRLRENARSIQAEVAISSPSLQGADLLEKCAQCFRTFVDRKQLRSPLPAGFA